MIRTVAEYHRNAANGISTSPDERFALLRQRERIAVGIMMADAIDFDAF